MSGDVQRAARLYRDLSSDERLREHERAQAMLWVGTALTKAGEIDSAITEIDRASRLLEDLGEPGDWGIAQQKRALAHLAAGDITGAARTIELAASHWRSEAPLEQVQLNTARGHILVSDLRTLGEGLAVLAAAHDLAARHGLTHQLQWIEQIQHIPETDRRPS